MTLQMDRKLSGALFLLSMTLGICGCIGGGPHGGPAIGIPGYGWLWYPGIEDGQPSSVSQYDLALPDKISGSGGHTLETALVIRGCRDPKQVRDVENWYVGAFGRIKEETIEALTVDAVRFDVFTYSRWDSGKAETVYFNVTRALE